MAINQITYADKSYINQNVGIADTNKLNDTDANEIKSVVNANAQLLGDGANLSETSVIQAINNIRGTIAWTNPNPTSSFSGQTITLDVDLSNYDSYEILFRQNQTSSRLMSTGKIPVGYGTILHWNTGNGIFRPTATTVSGSSITFEDGKNGGTTANDYTIPYMVIVYNTGLFGA